MGKIAGSWSFNLHSLTGLLALVCMAVHALWACIVLMRKKPAELSGFHKLSLFVWILWLIPFVLGMIMAMGINGMNTKIESYITSFPPETQERLLQIRSIFLKEVPDAQEDIRYQMPTLIWHGNLIHYAAFKNHIGVYPLPSVIEALKDDIRNLKTGKGSIQFSNSVPLPVELIQKIVHLRKEEKIKELAQKGISV